VDLRASTVRSQFYTSLLPLAEWIVNAWPQLIQERIRPDHDQRGWRAAHSLRSGRGGGPMPDVRIWRGSQHRFHVHAREDATTPPGIGLSFVHNLTAEVSAETVTRQLARVVDAVRDRLRETDAWLYGDLTRRWQEAGTPRAEVGGRLGLCLEDLAELTEDELAALAAFESDPRLISIGESSSSDSLSDKLTAARELAAALPEPSTLQLETPAWQQLRPAPEPGSPWQVGWGAATALRTRTQLDDNEPLGERLSPWLQRTFNWQEADQLRSGPRRGGIDLIVLRPQGRFPVAMSPHRSDTARRFRIAKALYYAMSADDEELVVDSARTPRSSEANAFAAELLAPRSFLARHIPSDRTWFEDDVARLAELCAVDTKVIEHQVQNRDLGRLAA
jgi:hypothetical protein